MFVSAEIFLNIIHFFYVDHHEVASDEISGTVPEARNSSDEMLLVLVLSIDVSIGRILNRGREEMEKQAKPHYYFPRSAEPVVISPTLCPIHVKRRATAQIDVRPEQHTASFSEHSSTPAPKPPRSYSKSHTCARARSGAFHLVLLLH